MAVDQSYGCLFLSGDADSVGSDAVADTGVTTLLSVPLHMYIHTHTRGEREKKQPEMFLSPNRFKINLFFVNELQAGFLYMKP